MTAAAVTELDQQTIAELDALDSGRRCEFHGYGPDAEQIGTEDCTEPPRFALTFYLECGHRGLTLLCGPHLRELLRSAQPWGCSLDKTVAPARRLDWDTL